MGFYIFGYGTLFSAAIEILVKLACLATFTNSFRHMPAFLKTMSTPPQHTVTHHSRLYHQSPNITVEHNYSHFRPVFKVLSLPKLASRIQMSKLLFMVMCEHKILRDSSVSDHGAQFTS